MEDVELAVFLVWASHVRRSRSCQKCGVDGAPWIWFRTLVAEILTAGSHSSVRVAFFFSTFLQSRWHEESVDQTDLFVVG